MLNLQTQHQPLLIMIYISFLVSLGYRHSMALHSSLFLLCTIVSPILMVPLRITRFSSLDQWDHLSWHNHPCHTSLCHISSFLSLSEVLIEEEEEVHVCLVTSVAAVTIQPIIVTIDLSLHPFFLILHGGQLLSILLGCLLRILFGCLHLGWIPIHIRLASLCINLQFLNLHHL